MTQAPRARPRQYDEAEFERQLAAARGGSAEALGQLLQGCRQFLLLAAGRALESTLRPKEGASDLVQRTFVVAHRGFQAFRGATLGELLAWLNRILERQLANQIRHYKHTSKRAAARELPLDGGDHPDHLGLVDSRAQPAERAASADEQRRVHQALDELPPDYRRVLVLRTWQRLPFAEIGRQMGRSTDAVQKLWMRAIQRLEEALGNLE
jgi:RNA polymerase sigma-70 factor (ECF subfamily)